MLIRFRFRNCLFDIVCQVIIAQICIINVRRLPLTQLVVADLEFVRTEDGVSD